MKSEANNAVSVYINTISIPYVRTSLLMLAGGMFLNTLQGCSLFQESPGIETESSQAQILEEATPVSSAPATTETVGSQTLVSKDTNNEPTQETIVEVSSQPAPAPDKPEDAVTEKTAAADPTIPEPTSKDIAKALTYVSVATAPETAQASTQSPHETTSSTTQVSSASEEDSIQNREIIKDLNSAPAPAAGQAITAMPSSNAGQDAVTEEAVAQAAAPKQNTKDSLHKLLQNLEQPSKPDQILGTYGIWELRKVWNGNESGCRLSTHTIQVDDDRFTSQIWVSVQPQHLILNASSEIHLNASGSGVRLDKGQLIPFTGQAIPSHAVLSDDLINRLAKSQKLHLYVMIGDLQSRVTHTEINLKDLRAAVGAFNKCRS
ncbi:hypothetical protein BTA51_24420 [Hahella sp. CCB-MM4]|uniref:hypothetical protein n=1 Tax=Hahella sp. (strain CCB-MM4) TaxID=1926491 RepID=UPI000B9A995A|nr:hypothetical protein [Hahella sp. CCB-MM4]OZG70734.1 hypothetical protein BTA51_24420 [Hahella sp. CCB-MM4]